MLLEGCSGAWLGTAGGVLDTGAEELLSDSLVLLGLNFTLPVGRAFGFALLYLADACIISQAELLSSLSLLHPVAVTEQHHRRSQQEDMSLVFMAGQSFQERVIRILVLDIHSTFDNFVPSYSTKTILL